MCTFFKLRGEKQNKTVPTECLSLRLDHYKNILISHAQHMCDGVIWGGGGRGRGRSLSHFHCNCNFMNISITAVVIFIYLRWSFDIC